MPADARTFACTGEEQLAHRAAARAALRFLLEREGEIPSVVVVGQGFGSVFAIDLFSDELPRRVKGLVLDGALTDVAFAYHAVSAEHQVLPLLCASLDGYVSYYELNLKAVGQLLGVVTERPDAGSRLAQQTLSRPL